MFVQHAITDFVFCPKVRVKRYFITNFITALFIVHEAFRSTFILMPASAHVLPTRNNMTSFAVAGINTRSSGSFHSKQK